MDRNSKRIIGVDLFAGAGGMSLGAQMAGVEVALAVENDPHAAATYKHNHPETKLFAESIENLTSIKIPRKGVTTVLFGGPPCQGFSTSNRRTRNQENNSNWLFKEFIRVAQVWKPDWVVFENVRGFVETEGGMFHDAVIQDLEKLGYTCSHGVLCASDFGVPQVRSRFFLVASRQGISLEMPKPESQQPVTVKQAIGDLPSLTNGATQDYLTSSASGCA